MWRSEDHQVYSIRLYFAESFFQTCYRKKFFIQRVASEIAKENAGNEGGIMKITYINHSGFLIETRDYETGNRDKVARFVVKTLVLAQ